MTDVTVTASGEMRDIPLNKLKKSPKNARKTPHTEAAIEALAASIAAKGMLQAPVVEPEVGEDGEPTALVLIITHHAPNRQSNLELQFNIACILAKPLSL